MVYTVYIPAGFENKWDNYWCKTDYRRELALCETDGLLPILERYLTKKQKILEAGCGLGKWVVYFYRRGYQITGIENNHYAIGKIKKYEPKVKIKFADVRRLPFQDNSIDVYLSFGVIEHFQEGPQIALREAYRVLKPGGLAVIEVPYDNFQRITVRNFFKIINFFRKPLKKLLLMLRLKEIKPKFKVEFYEYHFNKKEIARLVRDQGFKIINFYPKDDLDPKKSIGLWLDFPFLRKIPKVADFQLTKLGKNIKMFYDFLHGQKLYSACLVCLVNKP